jgi:N-acetylgalactosamine-N,N'-diacetylbacillosaminyl-diphospho-undecaprenol 4-alpha-N-acetylgalactosaminyltransferase
MKPKIAFFINGMVIGGAEKDLRLLIETMKDQYDIHLILKIKHEDMPIFDDVPIYYLTERETKSGLNFLLIPLFAWRYKRYLEKHSIPVSYSQLTRPNLTAAFTRILGWKGRLILGEKSSPVGHYQAYGLSGKIILRFIKSLYKYADLIIPNSEGTRITLEETLHIPTRYEVIYNAIDIEKTKKQGLLPLSMPLPKGAEKNRFTYICVSNLWEHKNQQLLIRAMQQVPHLDCQLWLVGVGSEEEKLRRLVIECGQQSRVFILGYRHDALQLMAKADCFITATRAEGLPNAQIEALTLGLPVISSDCLAGPRELLATKTDPHRRITTGIEEGDCGILVATDDIKAMTMAMERMYSDSHLRDAFKAAGPLSVERFAYSAIMEKTTKSFDQFYV